MPFPSSSSPLEALLLLHHLEARQRPVELQQKETLEIQPTNNSIDRINSSRVELTSFGGGRVISFLVTWGLVNVHVSRGGDWAGKVHNPFGQNRDISRWKKTQKERTLTQRQQEHPS